MASLEDEVRDLKEKNNELAQKVQYWKMTAAQRENEKLNLMKEINELRLKLSKHRSNSNVQARNLEDALQSTSEKALAHIVRASGEIARTIELTKAYMRDREQLDAVPLHWNSVGNASNSDRKDKVHRVPPLMIGGQSIQPVVALTMLDTGPTTRSPNQNRPVTERALPMHMLQDVYIPLTRIDADMQAQNMETESPDEDADDSSEELGLDDGEEREADESEQMLEDDGFETRRLDAVTEESDNEEVTPPRNRILENPLEGPSWMLDVSTDNQVRTSKSRTTLEADSTTEVDEAPCRSSEIILIDTDTRIMEGAAEGGAARSPRAFTPTVRRRKRPSSPPPAPLPRRSLAASRRTSNSGRVLKVMVAKMRLDGAGDASPPKRAAALAYDAPSPNGATVAGVISSETHRDLELSFAAGEPAPRRSDQDRRPDRDDRRSDRDDRRSDRDDRRSDRDDRRIDRDDRRPDRDESRPDRMARMDTSDRPLERHGEYRDSRDTQPERRAHQSHNRSHNRSDNRAGGRRDRDSPDSRESDSSEGAPEGRTRRTRKVVTYKEKKLNTKLRR